MDASSNGDPNGHSDPWQRRKIQNRLSQRHYREQLRQNTEKNKKPGIEGPYRYVPLPTPPEYIPWGPSPLNLRIPSLAQQIRTVFVYQGLTTRTSIRILEICPGQPTDELTCRMHYDDVDHPVLKYVALSYVWGKSPARTGIICSEALLHVTPNLRDALCRLRLPHSPVYVWADGACINQFDTTERGHQVKLMRSIYKGAASVAVWLGHDLGGHAEEAFSLICNIVNNKHQMPRRKWAGFNLNGKPHPGTLTSDTPSPQNPLWESLGAFFNIHWFWRLWVVQEITLASVANLYWGNACIRWPWVGIAATWIRTHKYELLHRLKMDGVYNAYLMYRLSGADNQGRQELVRNISFARLLGLTSQFEVTDPRDRIYAILGLPTADTDPDKGQLFMEPDYTLSVDEVYQAFTLRVLQTESNLNILASVQHGASIRDDLPSWIRDWRNVYTHVLTPSDPDSTYNASGGLPYEHSPSLNSRVLKLKGIELVRIASCSNTFSDKPFVARSPRSSIERSLFVQHIASFWPGFTDFTKHNTTLAFTLTAGKDWYGGLIETQKDSQNLLADFAAFCLDTCSPELGIAGNSVSRLPALHELAAHGDMDRFSEAASRACVGRRLFITSQGKLGLGPEAMKDNDVMTVLFGAPAPFILRKDEGTRYRLVGEAYIHGYMQGEAIPSLEYGTPTSQVFELV